MSDTGNPIVLWLALAAIVLLIVLVVCWIILPFAIIGTKPLLRELLAEQRSTNQLLTRLEAELALQRHSRPTSGDNP